MKVGIVAPVLLWSDSHPSGLVTIAAAQHAFLKMDTAVLKESIEHVQTCKVASRVMTERHSCGVMTAIVLRI